MFYGTCIQSKGKREVLKELKKEGKILREAKEGERDKRADTQKKIKREKEKERRTRKGREKERQGQGKRWSE